MHDLLELPGTMRARTPEEAWALVSEHLPAYGITRVARLTGLDCIGLPVATAIRPRSRTLVTSQGKGATDLLARLSAVMESIELWHVEQPVPIAATGPAKDINPGYPVSMLPLTTRLPDPVLSGLVWDWTTGTSLLRGRDVLVPADLIRRRAQRPQWGPDLLRATSTGLACGTTRHEALLHALYEVVERDVLYRDEQAGGAMRTLIDVGTVQDPYARDVVDRLEAAGMALEVSLVEGPYELPVCVAYLWAEDYPVVFAGGGCHSVPAIALTRALTEAAQSRLSAIAGTRDDLPSDPGQFGVTPTFPARGAGLVPWPAATALMSAPLTGTFSDAVGDVAQRIYRVTGQEPMALDLSDGNSPVHAVQVVCPGTRSRIRRAMPR